MTFQGIASTTHILVASGLYRPAAAAQQDAVFQLNLPTNKGTLKLYVDDITYGIQAADATNYIDSVNLYGETADGNVMTYIAADGTNQTSAGAKTWTRSPTDMSSYKAAIILMRSQNAGTSLRFGPPFASCYYA